MASMGRPAKRAKLLNEAGSDSEPSEDEGVQLPNGGANGFKINEDYAKRFEYNKKREEKQRLEEKYKGANGKRARDDEDDLASEDEDESTDESEDDDAELADVEVDQEIFDTLKALKSKDPRIYDSNVKFYKDWEAREAEAADGKAKKDKPMYLQDYHRQNLLAGYAGGEDAEQNHAPQTYDQEQDALKRQLVGSMHASAPKDESDAEDEDAFLVTKSRPQHEKLPATAPAAKKITENDIAAADKDPENYLSNFMAARGWIENEGSRFQPFDSDNSDDERKADEFEEAFNLRFENPAQANETLKSYGRDVGKYGVRRDETTGRQRAREREKERKEAEKREREEERARLRKLKIDEAEEKVKRIREAAGLRGKDVDLKQWRDIIEGDFDDDEWDQEMKRRFGENYYAEDEGGDEAGSEDEDAEPGAKRRKVKKPKWEDDVDINDLIPDFEDEDAKPQFSLSDDEDVDSGAPVPGEKDDEDELAERASKKKRTTKKDRQQAKADAKRAARVQRRAIEEMVDQSLPVSHPSPPLTSSSSNNVAALTPGFHYRATSPTSFGLSARDILFADDAQLNTFAGLKKMHSFRDADKKKRDKKRFSKKARLREWRRETFGDAEGAGEREWSGRGGDGGGMDERMGGAGGVEGGVREGERKKKRKRSGRKGKGGGAVEA